MNTIDYESHVVEYKVMACGRSGTITLVYQPQLQEGDFERNIQTQDENGNFIGFDGTIEEIYDETILG